MMPGKLYFAVCALVLLVSSAWTAEKPNVIVIMADDLGYMDLSCYGCKDIPTPHIDSLAADGVRFTSAYVTWPMCGPSRAGFLTGRHQSTFGYYQNISQPFDPKQGLPKMDTIASLMKKQGYVTGGVGKWHMGTTNDQHPNAMGFDDWFGFLGGGLMYFPLDHPSYKGRFNPLKRPAKGRDLQHTMPVIHNDKPVEWDQCLTRELTEAGLRFLNKNHKQPFFLFMSYNAPHLDLEAPEESIAKFPAESMTVIPGVTPMARSIYGAMVYEMDEGVGQLLATIDDLGLTENTVIWFLSDNGGMRKTSDSRPLRGTKGNVYEGGIRVPMIVKWPGKWPSEMVREEPITSLDITATSVAMAGGDPIAAGLHGKDVRSYISGETNEAPHDVLYWRTGRSYKDASGVIRVGDYKLIVQRGKVELYNLSDDLGEQTNMARQQPERVKTMLNQWKEWDKGSQPDLWQSSNKAYQYADYKWLKGSQHYRESSSVEPEGAFKNAVESQDMKVVSKPKTIQPKSQDLKRYQGVWNADNQTLFKGAKVGDVVELGIPATGIGPQKLVLYATKSFSFGILRLTINSQPAGEDVDLYAANPTSTGPIELGAFTPVDGAYQLRIEVIGKNTKSKSASFGIDCVTVNDK